MKPLTIFSMKASRRKKDTIRMPSAPHSLENRTPFFPNSSASKDSQTQENRSFELRSLPSLTEKKPQFLLHDIPWIRLLIQSSDDGLSGAVYFKKHYSPSIDDHNNDLQGNEKRLRIAPTGFVNDVAAIHVLPDMEWLCTKINQEPSQTIQITFIPSESHRSDAGICLRIASPEGEHVVSLNTILEFLPHGRRIEKRKHTLEFDDAYMLTKEFGWIKIQSMCINYDVVDFSKPLRSQGKRIIHDLELN